MRIPSPTVSVLILVCSLLSTPVCAQPLAPVDPRVKTEISAVDAQIKEAEQENAEYTGGLVKALIESRDRRL